MIKQDFGYADNGTRNNPATSNPYLVVYNRYRGTMRIFIARGDQKTFNGANIQINFITGNPMESSLLDLSGQLKALDALYTKGKTFISVTKFIDQPLKWFYADFPMTYDPCTCLYESKLEIKVTLSSESTLTASGTISGSIVSDGKPAPAQEGKSSFAIGDINAAGKKITEGFKTGTEFKNSVDAAINGLINANNKAGKLNAVGSLMTNLKNNTFLKNGLASLSFIGAAVSVLDMFTGGGKTSGGPVEIAPMSINMTQKLTGTIKTNNPYNTITVRTPGSKYTSYPNTEYPYYNEVLGVFNLLKTPVFLKKKQCINNQDGTYSNNEYYRLSQNIQYVINPSANVDVQEIQGALLIYADAPAGDFTEYEARDEVAGKDVYRTNYFNLRCLPSLDLLYGKDDIKCYGDHMVKGIKFLVNLKRKDAGPNTQNILLVSTYPTSETKVTTLPAPPACSNTLLPPVDKTTVNTFCTSTAYTASGRFARNYNQAVIELVNSEAENNTNINFSSYLKVLPNPTTGYINANFFIPRTGKAKIYLTNALGQQIKVLFDNSLNTGKYKMQFNVDDQPNGIYFLSIRTNNTKITKKVIINK